jgi:TRAP-type C4-dicarboxylate transport system substrate-binding protein
MKKLFSIALVLVMLLSCASALAEVTLTYAEVNPVNGTVVGDVALAFKDKLEELSGGEVKVDIKDSGVMGDEKSVLGNILAGDDSVDVVRISAFALNQYGAQKSVFLTLPYVFTSEDHYWKFVESDLAKQFLAEAKEVGLPLTGLAYGEEGFRHFFLKNEAHTIDDLKGLKIRVSDDPIMTGMVSGLGAAATTVSFGELYTSLQSGVVDAAEQPITNYLSNSFQEVAPYLLKDGHTLGTIELIITDAAMDKLTAEQQAMVQEAADYAMQVCKASVTEKQAEAEKTLIDGGYHVIEVEDKTPWQEATKSVLEENIKGMEDIYEQIMALQ